ncbi:glycosyltransferase [Streptomyces albidoflavus]|uniref:glycosyltransferase n=1 Tax=Streptomyces albidoflavus TaxID=1886 RepID=UPI0033ADA2F9
MLALADVVISRSGAGTLAEHGAVGRRGSPPPAAGPRPGLRGGCGPARTGCG